MTIILLSSKSHVGYRSAIPFNFAGLPVAFISFVLYEKKEEEIDNLAVKVLSSVCKLKSDITGKICISKKQQ